MDLMNMRTYLQLKSCIDLVHSDVSYAANERTDVTGSSLLVEAVRI